MATDSLEIANMALSKIGAKTITSLTADSCKEDRTCNRFLAKFRDELLTKYMWNFAKKATPLNRQDLYETSDDYSDYVTITNITTGNPPVVTGANSYVAGSIILISDVGGMDEVNDIIFEIAASSTTTFSLLGVDAGKYTVYTSGGKAIQVEALTDYRNGYTYAMPTDCLRTIELDSKLDFEIYQTLLLTTDEAPILVYIKQVTDTTKFPPGFEECLVTKLSAELCMPILGAKEGIQMRKEMERIHRQALAEALKTECKSIQKAYTYTDTYLSTRK